MEGIDVPQILSMVGSVGFAVWAAFHMISRTIPQLIEQHAKEREATLNRFEVTLDKITTHCKEELHTIVAAITNGKP